MDLRQDSPSQRLALPANVRVEERADGMVIIRRWFHWSVIPLALFCAVWDGFLIFMFVAASKSTGGEEMAMMALFSVFHVTVGLGMAYYALAMFLNTTTIRVTPQQLTVEHAPLPWFGQRQLDPAYLTQLYCKQKIHRNKNGTSYSYQLRAVTLEDKDIKLISGLKDPDQVHYIEQQLEQWLAIENQPVAGEYTLRR